MAKRKTMDVEAIKERVNYFLKHSEEDKKGMRQGQMMLLETILHETGNYAGFKYLPQWEVATQYPGIWLNEDGTHDPATCFENTDNTRVRYF